MLETKVAKLEEQIKNLQEASNRHCRSIKETRHNLEEFKIYVDEKITDLDRRMTEKVEKIVQDLSKRLPLWATLLISLLSSLSVGLAVFVIKWVS